MACLLDIRRTIRIFESRRLKVPIAFGLIRPAICLPPQFTQQFSPAQQQAILAHELAHLAAGDQFWLLLADLLAAAMWWHPLIWWSRSQLRSACETAADEASRLVVNGPRLLAECLLDLGHRLTRPRFLVGMGVDGGGFQSGLGKRVKRLLELPAGNWSPPHTKRLGLAKIFGPLTLALTALLCTAWVTPSTFKKGEPMNHLQHSWNRSLIAVAIINLVGANQPAALADPLNDPPQPARAAPATAAAPRANKVAPPVAALEPSLAQNKPPETKPGRTPPAAGDAAALHTSRGRQRLQAKLEQIILDEVVFEGTLQDMVAYLNDQAQARDRERKGINFVIIPSAPAAYTLAHDAFSPDGQRLVGPSDGAATPSPYSMDPELAKRYGLIPMTGQPQPKAKPRPQDHQEVSETFLRIHPPLRDVRLADVLDVITKVASRPIKYAIEEYGIVFSENLEGPAQLATQTFRLHSKTLLQGLQNIFEMPIADPGSPQKLVRQFLSLMGSMSIPPIWCFTMIAPECCSSGRRSRNWELFKRRLKR